jgi:hypothetical protein
VVQLFLCNKEDTVASFFLTQIRTIPNENCDSTRDWLHDNCFVVATHKTFDACNATLDEKVGWFLGALYLDEEPPGPLAYEKKQTYEENRGGGFWFEFRTPDGQEGQGRALVLEVVVPD